MADGVRTAPNKGVVVVPENYAVAATRHFQDAVLLEKNRRFSNADQLFGFAAECAIKRALVELPGVLAEGRLAGTHRKHVNHLWNAVQIHSIHRRYPRLVLLLKGLPQPFHDWSTDQRYGSDEIVTDEAIERHRRAAARLLGSVGLNGTRSEATR